MESSTLIIYMITACITFLLLILLSKPIKHLIKLLVQGFCGFVGLMFFNSVLAGFNIFIGINFLTIFIVSVLGLPGFISLYVIKLFILK